MEGVTLTDEDRAVFTIKRKTGATLIQKIVMPEDGVFYVPFTNDETDGWKPGQYEWDLRIVLGAVTNALGEVTDGREVITPWAPNTLEVVKVVGEV